MHKHFSVLPYTTKLAQTRSTTTVYYKACSKSFPVLLYTTKLAQTRCSTTVYCKACTNTFQYYGILQSLHEHVAVLPYTTKLAQTRSRTTVYYKAYTTMRFCSFSHTHGEECTAKRTRFADVCSFPHRHGINDAKRTTRKRRENFRKKCTPLWREAHFQVKSVKN